MSGRFEGKRALVTGGSSGIGRAIAVALAREGCQVVATGLTRDGLDSFGQDGIEGAVLDVTDQAGFEALVARLDRLDVLVNAAGMILREGKEHELQGFLRVLDVNLAGVMRACIVCRPRLAEVRGCVLNVASMLSFFGGGAVPGYSASKGGIAQLTKSLAIAWAPDGIRVNAVAPGWIATPLTQPLREAPDRNRAILERTPLGRWGEPEDVAGPALFLCSREAAFVTGAILPVDGGYSVA